MEIKSSAYPNEHGGVQASDVVGHPALLFGSPKADPDNVGL